MAGRKRKACGAPWPFPHSGDEIRLTFQLDIRADRNELIRVFEELHPKAAPPSAFARSYVCQILAQIIDQMGGARDPRTVTLPWQIALLAVALVDRRGVQPKAAIIAAIKFLAPARAADAETSEKFRAFIERTYSKLRRGKNPAQASLLPVAALPDVLLDMAAAHL
jgi:hypothetical protein